MKIAHILLSLSAAASAPTAVASIDGSISAESKMGQMLLSKARQLENKNNNNYYYYSWLGKASIKFDGCASIPRFERDEGLRSDLVAKFKLCPNNDCGSCRNAGEYIVDMKDFIETYQEAQKEANEYACETANYECETACENGYSYGNNNQANYNYNNNNNGQNNNNNNNNNNNCVYYCLVDKKLDYCVEGEQGGGQQDVKDLSECRALNGQNGQNGNNNKNNNNYNYGSSSGYSSQIYYVGAYCTSSGVYVGTFTDSSCTKHAPSGTYEKYMYGYSLPTTPLVTTSCLSCTASSNNNNNNNNGNNNNNNNNNNYNNGNSVSELCQKLYEQAGKCEKNLKGVTYQDNSACDMILNMLPRINSAFKSVTRGGPPVAKICAWAFGVGFFALAGYVFLLHKKVMRQKAELESNGYISGDVNRTGIML